MSFKSAKSVSLATQSPSTTDLSKNLSRDSTSIKQESSNNNSTCEFDRSNGSTANFTAAADSKQSPRNPLDASLHGSEGCNASFHMDQLAVPNSPHRKNSTKSLDEKSMLRTQASAQEESPTTRSARTSQHSLSPESTTNIGLGFARSVSQASFMNAAERPKAGSTYRVIEDYAAADADELTLKRGDIVELILLPTADNEFWWFGIKRTWDGTNGQKGYFPSSSVIAEEQYAANLEHSKSPKAAKLETPTSAESVAFDENSTIASGTIVSVTYGYQPTKADEMELCAGEQIIVTEGPSGGWWRGSSLNSMASKVPKMGWFPAVCVSLLVARPGDSHAIQAKQRSSVIDNPTSASSSSSLNAEAQDGIGSLRTLHRPQQQLSTTSSPAILPMYPTGSQTSSGIFQDGGSLPAPMVSAYTPNQGPTSIPSSPVVGPMTSSNLPAPAGSTKRMSWYKRLVTKKDNSAASLINSSSSTTNLLSNSGSGTFAPSPAIQSIAAGSPVVSGTTQRSRSWSAPAPNSSHGSNGSSGDDMRLPGAYASYGNAPMDLCVPPKHSRFMSNPPEMRKPDGVIISETNSSSSGPDMWWKDLDKSVLQGLSQEEKLRQMAIFELINTERDYVRDLQTICNLYETPLLEKKLLGQKNSETVFSNVSMLLKIHEGLLKQLEKRRKEQGPIILNLGDMFIKSADAFVAYHVYCSNHSASLVKLENLLQSSRSLRNYVEEAAKQPQCRGMPLNSFLIKPVQRICKYPLLLKDILKHTEPEQPDAQALRSALDKVEMIINLVNEGARQADGVRKMLDIQSRFAEKNLNIVSADRYLLREDVLYLVYGGLNKPRRLFLFNNLLMIARKDWRDKYHVIEKAVLENVTVSDIDESSAAYTQSSGQVGKLEAQPMFEVAVRPNNSNEEDSWKRYTFAASTHGIKFAWLDAYRQLTQTSVPVKTFCENENLASNWDLQVSDDSGTDSVDVSYSLNESHNGVDVSDASEKTFSAVKKASAYSPSKSTQEAPAPQANTVQSLSISTLSKFSSADSSPAKDLSTTRSLSPFSKAATLAGSEKSGREAMLTQIKELQSSLQQEKEKSAFLQKQLDEQTWHLQESKLQLDSANEKTRFEQDKLEKQTTLYKQLEQDQQRLINEVNSLKADLSSAKDLMSKEVESHYLMLHEKDRQVNEQAKQRELLEADHKLLMERLRSQINELMRTSHEERLRLKSEHQASLTQLQMKFEATSQELQKITNQLEQADRDKNVIKASLTEELTSSKQSMQHTIDEYKEKLHESLNVLAKKDAEVQNATKEVSRLESELAKTKSHQQAQLELRHNIESAVKEKAELLQKMESEAAELKHVNALYKDKQQQLALELEHLKKDYSFLQKQEIEMKDHSSKRESKITELKFKQTQNVEQIQALRHEIQILQKGNGDLIAEKAAWQQTTNALEQQASRLRTELEKKSSLIQEKERKYYESKSRQANEEQSVQLRDQQVASYIERLAHNAREIEQLHGKVEDLQDKLYKADSDRRAAEREERRIQENLAEKAHAANIERERTQNELIHVSRSLEVLRAKEMHLEVVANTRLADSDQMRKELMELKHILEVSRGAYDEKTKTLELAAAQKVQDLEQRNKVLESKCATAEGVFKQLHDEQALLQERLASDAERIGSLQATVVMLEQNLESSRSLKQEISELHEQAVQAAKDIECKAGRVKELNSVVERLKEELNSSKCREEALGQQANLYKDQSLQCREQIAQLQALLRVKEEQIAQGQANFNSLNLKSENLQAHVEKTADQSRQLDAERVKLQVVLDSKEGAVVHLQEERLVLAEKLARLETSYATTTDRAIEAEQQLQRSNLKVEQLTSELDARALASAKNEQSLVLLQKQTVALKEANLALQAETMEFKREQEEKLARVELEHLSATQKFETRVEQSRSDMAKLRSKLSQLQSQLKKSQSEHEDVLEILEKQIVAYRKLEADHVDAVSRIKFYDMIIKDISISVHHNLFRTTVMTKDGEQRVDGNYDEACILAMTQVIHNLKQKSTETNFGLQNLEQKLNDANRELNIATKRAEAEAQSRIKIDQKLAEALNQCTKWKEEAAQASKALDDLNLQVLTLLSSLKLCVEENSALKSQSKGLLDELGAKREELGQLQNQQSELRKELERVAQENSKLCEHLALSNEKQQASGRVQSEALQKQILSLQRQLGETQTQALHIIRQLRDRVLKLQSARDKYLDQQQAKDVAFPLGSRPDASMESQNRQGMATLELSTSPERECSALALNIKKAILANDSAAIQKQPHASSYGLATAEAPPFAHLDIMSQIRNAADATFDTGYKRPAFLHVGSQSALATRSSSPKSPLKSLLNKAASPRLGRGGCPLI